MTETRGEEAQTIEWGGVVRLRLPAGWRLRTEEHEGHTVAAVDPPCGSGTLRLVTDVLAAKDGPGVGPGGTAVLLRELALRFVRPDDPRAGDRVLEDRPGGGVIATAMMRTDEKGRAEVHYLWLVGAERDGRAAVAMASVAVPAALDGGEAEAALLDHVDSAMRAAEIL